MPSFAVPVPEDIVKQPGALTRFPVVVHANHALCLEISRKFGEEFNAALNVQLDPKAIGNYPQLGIVHTFPFTMPECLPERLPVMTRPTDFTFFNDGAYTHVESILNLR